MLRDAGDARRARPAFASRRWRWLGLLPALAGCAGPDAPVVPVVRSSALTRTLPPTSDTFINSHNPDNNNGASLSIFTGLEGLGGVMRGLIRFDLPATLQGRVTVTGVQLTLTTRGLGASDSIAGTAATESLQAVTEAWAAGNGAGNAQTLFVVGEPCAGSITGATWNQPDCGASATGWMTIGGSVAPAISGQAVAPAALDSAVVWDAAAAGNAGMIADVQRWIDNPVSNHGWRIASSTETGVVGSAQRFYAVEATINVPGLVLAYDCKAGFAASGNDCTACTPAALAACTAAAGNACADSGGPAPTYACVCGNAAYVAGIGGDGTAACLDRDGCLENHCRDAGDTGATCTDQVAPATGYRCACSAGFTFDGTSCVRSGTGGAPGTGGVAGTGGAAGATGGAADRDGGRDGGAVAPPSSGCSCAIGGGGPAPIAIFGLAVALVVVRRRRSRRAT
ncbi:MAG TPA: DNRLRE domain-containing protein [Polyangia bacterium]|jgi:MYXO-CTERM domain-containing protein|nr:DNRLRE domain-containing protein [Polyangia bacterium]